MGDVHEGTATESFSGGNPRGPVQATVPAIGVPTSGSDENHSTAGPPSNRGDGSVQEPPARYGTSSGQGYS